MRRLLLRKNVTACRGSGEGVRYISTEERKPAVVTMPHSEYPSASAFLCTASMEQLELALIELLGKNVTNASPELVFNPAVLGILDADP